MIVTGRQKLGPGLGPALVAGEWDDFWVYVAGPLAGAGIAGFLYTMVFMDSDGD